MLPEELRNKWKEDAEEALPGDTFKTIRQYILASREISFYQGLNLALTENVDHYRDLLEEENCTCIRCLLEGSDEDDEDEDGRGRDGLPTNKLSIKEVKEELQRLKDLWDRS